MPFQNIRPRYPKIPSFRIKHLKPNLTLHLNERKIRGRAELVVVPKSDSRIIELDAVEMDIRSVRVNGKEIDFYYDGEKLKVDINGFDDEVKLEVNYEASPGKGLYFILSKDRCVVQVWSQREAEDTKYWIPIFDSPAAKFPNRHNDKSTERQGCSLEWPAYRCERRGRL